MIYNIKNFLSYKSNRQLDPKTICIELKKIIDQLILDKNLQLIVKRFSDLSEIPIDVLQFDLKKKIFLSFQFSKGKFSSKLNLVNLLKDLIYFISFYFWIMIFSKKLEVKKKS